VNIVSELAARFRPRGEHRRPPVERTDVVEVVASVLAFLRAEIERVAKVETVYTATPIVLMDRSALARVVTNLLLNAGQAMVERPGGIVTLEVAASEDHAFVRVLDTGPGIAHPEHGRVFEPYYTTREGGSGLGLAIVRDLVDQAQGRVSVLSALGRGATFEVQLPLPPK
jgi:signal transduction histidine kinase